MIHPDLQAIKELFDILLEDYEFAQGQIIKDEEYLTSRRLEDFCADIERRRDRFWSHYLNLITDLRDGEVSEVTSPYDLILLDVDDTLVEAFGIRFKKNVIARLESLPKSTQLALVTNQGGVTLRYWMESEGFGEPKKYPTYDDINNRLLEITKRIQGRTGLPVKIYKSLAYCTKKGKWSPTPFDHVLENPALMEQLGDELREFRHDWHKPEPGMVLQAIKDHKVEPGRVLVVGNSDEDRAAAEAASRVLGQPVAFAWADDFFGK